MLQGGKYQKNVQLSTTVDALAFLIIEREFKHYLQITKLFMLAILAFFCLH